MKNTEKNLDEIIFENRNKAYGAYALRKIYSKNLIRAMLIAFMLFLMGVSIPLIASYLNDEKFVWEDRIIEGVIIEKAIEKVEVKLPEAPKQKIERPQVFTPPVVTIDPNDVIEDFDVLMSQTLNRNIGDTGSVEIPEETIKPPVIEDDDKLITLAGVSEMPEFPGGDEERVKFLKENMTYPRMAIDIGLQGKVYIYFVIEKDGSISNVRIERGIGAGCDEEAARVIAMMPKWKPGRQNGREVRVVMNMPVAFVLK